MITVRDLSDGHYIKTTDLVKWLRQESQDAKTNGWDAHPASEVIAKLADALERAI